MESEASQALIAELEKTRQRLADAEGLLRDLMKDKGETILRQLEASRVRSQRETELASRDVVPSLLRHGHFRHRLSFELDRSRRTAEPLALLLVDLDGFRAFNEARGYREGERVLEWIGGSLESLWVVRPAPRPPILGREAGDCFGAILPGCDRSEVERRAEEIRNLIERLPVGEPRPTASLGGVLAGSSSTAEDLLGVARRALGEAQAGGGNRAIIRGPE
ncbi:MAG: GGDEF domain-containing protein [Deltaproteobacteria bacterium]